MNRLELNEYFCAVRSTDVGVMPANLRRFAVEKMPRALEPAVRLFRAAGAFHSSATEWVLQVRGPRCRADGSESRSTFIVASAHLSSAQLRALRDAIDERLKDGEEAPE